MKTYNICIMFRHLKDAKPTRIINPTIGQLLAGIWLDDIITPPPTPPTPVGKDIWVYTDGTIEEREPVMAIANNQYQQTYDLSGVTLVSATTIGDYAFDNCYYLSSVTLDEVTTIGDYAFHDNQNLTKFEAPKVVYIGAFALNPQSTGSYVFDANFPVLREVGESAFQAAGIESFNAPLLETIGDYAFDQCPSLTAFTFDSVETIGDYAFNQVPLAGRLSLPSCVSIGSMGLSNCAFSYFSAPSCTSCGTYALAYNTILEEIGMYSLVNVPDAFADGCTSLSTANFNSAISIGLSAFRGCTSLVGLNTPVCQSVGNSAFSGCTALMTFQMVGSTIGNNAFDGCTNLGMITTGQLPSLTDSNIFRGCTKLKMIRIGQNSASQGDIVLSSWNPTDLFDITNINPTLDLVDNIEEMLSNLDTTTTYRILIPFYNTLYNYTDSDVAAAFQGVVAAYPGRIGQS